MNKIFRQPTRASRLTSRSFIAFGAAVITVMIPTLLLTGCGGGGGGGTPSPSPSVGADQTAITGKILDLTTGSRGLAGATIQFGGVSARTDSNGNFTLIVPRNTAAGSAIITPPTGVVLRPYAATGSSCKNSPSFTVTGPLTDSSFSAGTVFVYSNDGNTPNPPCI